MITAILLSYYQERENNIYKMVDVLKKGTLPPDRIVLFNNNSEHKFKIDGIEIINSNTNFGAGIRFYLALGITSDYFFFPDDDMCPQTGTIENLMKYAEEDTCLGFCGKKLTKGVPYSKTPAVWSGEKPIDVNLLVGAGGIFCSYKALVKMVTLENKLRKIKEYDKGRETDLTLTMANKSLVIPVDGTNGITKFAVTGEGLVHEPIHADKRDEITKKILKLI